MTWEPCGSNQGACRVVVRDRATGKDHVVFSRKGASVLAFWAPDSRSIVVNVFQGAPGDVGIWAVRVDGSVAKRLYDVPVRRLADRLTTDRP